jgi:hypothetical protein
MEATLENKGSAAWQGYTAPTGFTKAGETGTLNLTCQGPNVASGTADMEYCITL